jgi:hypothetical protein
VVVVVVARRAQSTVSSFAAHTGRLPGQLSVPPQTMTPSEPWEAIQNNIPKSCNCRLRIRFCCEGVNKEPRPHDQSTNIDYLSCLPNSCSACCFLSASCLVICNVAIL